VSSLRIKLNPFFEKRKNQSFPAQKISKTSSSVKKMALWDLVQPHHRRNPAAYRFPVKCTRRCNQRRLIHGSPASYLK
jgi:hypothetical protein